MKGIEFQTSVTLPKVNYVPSSHKTVPKQSVANQPSPAVAPSDRQEDILELIVKIDRFVESLSTKISFSVDDRTGKSIIIVIEKDTGRIIRQIPPEEMLELAMKLEEISGIIFNGKA